MQIKILAFLEVMKYSEFFLLRGFSKHVFTVSRRIQFKELQPGRVFLHWKFNTLIFFISNNLGKKPSV